MSKNIILDGIENLPFGTNVTIQINETASMRAVSFGNKFGLPSGDFKSSEEIKERNWKVFLGWI